LRIFYLFITLQVVIYSISMKISLTSLSFSSFLYLEVDSKNLIWPIFFHSNWLKLTQTKLLNSYTNLLPKISPQPRSKSFHNFFPSFFLQRRKIQKINNKKFSFFFKTTGQYPQSSYRLKAIQFWDDSLDKRFLKRYYHNYQRGGNRKSILYSLSWVNSKSLYASGTNYVQSWQA